MIGAIALAVLVTIVIAIPKLRGIVAGRAAEVKRDIGDSLGVFRSPTKVMMIFGGNLAAVLLYAVVRFVIEFYRGDAVRGTVFGILSTSQFIALLMAVAVALILPYLAKRNRVTPPPA